MPNTEAKYLDRLLESREPGVDQAIAAALPSADVATCRRIAEALLERGEPIALRALILVFHKLPADVQHRIVESADTLYRPLREATNLTEGRRPALEIIRRCGDPKLAYLAASVLRDRDEAVRAVAGECLIELARQAATDHQRGVNWRIDAGGARELIRSVEEVVEHFGRGGQEAALIAAVWLLPRPMPELRKTLSQSTHPATSALRRMLEENEVDDLARGLLWLLSVPPLADAAIDALIDRLNRGSIHAVFDQWAMLLLPAAMPTLGRARRVARHVESFTIRGDLPAASAVGLLRLCDALPLEAAARMEMWRRATQHQDPAVRLLGVRRLAAAATTRVQNARGEEDDSLREAARGWLGELCEDDDEAVARAAATAWLRRREAMPLRPLASLVVNRHASIRQIAARRLGPMGFDRLWRAWPKLDPERRCAAAEALIRINAGFHNALGDRLVADDKDTRFQALDMVAELGQGHYFEKVLSSMSRGKDPKLAAAAVRALGTADTETGNRVVAEAFQSEVSEVRAEAVAALSPEEAGRCSQELLRMAHDEAPAPRAAAVRALLGYHAAEARQALRDMLGDDRPAHRAAAIRLVDDMSLITLARPVAEMAVSDPDESVRSGAWGAIGRLLAAMREAGVSTDDQAPPERAMPSAAGAGAGAKSSNGEDLAALRDPVSILGSIPA